MSRRTQIWILVALMAVLVAVYLANRTQMPGLEGVLASDGKSQPLNVDEPQLRLDLLAKLQKLEYSGSHRDIFSPVALPVQPTAAEIAKQNHHYPGVDRPPPPPPVEVPAQFFGYASMPSSPRRLAFFLNGDDVIVVQEGSVFLTRFRLDKIGNDSADVEESYSARHANVQMVRPPRGEAGPQAPNQ